MRKILILIVFILLPGCTIKETMINKKYEPVKVMGSAIEERKIKDLIAIKDDVEKIPDYQVDFEFYKGVNVKNFFGALTRGLPNVGIIIDFINPENEIIVPKFKGTLKEFCRMLQNTYGYSYKVSGKNIIIKDNSQVVIKVPSVIQGNEKEIKDMMSIFEVSSDDIHIDMSRGVVVALMDAKQYKNIREYLRKNGIYQYYIDIAVIEDTSTKEETVGLDLSQLSTVLTNITDGTVIKALGNTLSITALGNTAKLSAVVQNRLSIDAVLAAYGSLKEMRLDQRMKLGVLSGSTAKVDLSRKVPYVSKINATSGSTGAAATGYEFDTAQDGLVIEIKPSGDDESVNLDTTINYQQITEYLDLATGEYKVSRPVVQARSYKAQYCMSPGEVTLIGSLRVLNNSHNKRGLVTLQTYKDETIKVTDLSIFMGVSVVKFKMI